MFFEVAISALKVLIIKGYFKNLVSFTLRVVLDDQYHARVHQTGAGKGWGIEAE